MSWRTVVITQRCKMDLKLGNMVIRTEDIKRVNLDEVSVIIVEDTAVSITACLLNEISSRKIKLIFCDEKRNPASELMSIYGAHDCSAKIKSQMNWREDTKELVWTAIVSEKIRKQAKLLYKIGKNDEAEMLKNYIQEMELGDTTNREGHAAKVYFNGIFGMTFTRSAENSTNAALNYGYSILLSTINREVVSNGYLTQLGLFHDNMFNYFNLSCDLMEPFRPIIDEIVFSGDYNLFESNQKHTLVYELFNLRIIINKNEYSFTNAVQLYCRSVFEALNKNDVTLIKFYERAEDSNEL